MMHILTGRRKVVALATAMVFTIATMGTAMAASTTPSLKVTVVDDDLVIASLKAFDPSASIEVAATVAGGSGTTTLTANAQGRAVAAFSAPDNFTGKVTVTATSGDITKTATATVGTAETPTTEKATGTTPTTKVKGSTPTTTAKAGDDEGTTPTTKVAATKTSTASGGTKGKFASNLSGLGWASGAWVTGGGATKGTAFGDFRGRPIDIGLYYPSRGSWGNLSEFGEVEGKDWAVALSLPAFPEDGSSYGACASGSYNSQWATIANNLKSKGFDNPGKAVIRLAWEFNINAGRPANSASDFVGCWKQIHDTAAPIVPNIAWDWNPNRGGSQVSGDSMESYYPGDAYVDIIGIDTYNAWASLDEQLNGQYAMNFWLNFAKQHGKKFSVPEWGPGTGTQWAGHNNGDTAEYIQMMFDFFSKNAADMAYEIQFDSTESYCGCSTSDANQNPVSHATYKKLWGAGA